MTNLTQQIYKNLSQIADGFLEDSIDITQIDKSTIYCKALRYGKFEEKFTVERTPKGNVKKNSVRFYN